MKGTKSKASKVLLSGSIDPDVYEALQAHCRRRPQTSRSAVVSRALRQYLLPDYQEERERVLAANLDRLWWHQHNLADRLDRDLATVREMLAMLVRTFYIHIPEVPEPQREGAILSGEQRFNRFLAVVAEHLGPGKSSLQRMPEPEIVEAMQEPPVPPNRGANEPTTNLKPETVDAGN